MDTCSFNDATPAFGICLVAVCLLVGLAVSVLMVLIFCKIFSKAGYHWAMGLLVLVPFGNIIVLCVLAFGQWPVLRELQALKQDQIAPPPGDQPHESFRGN